MKAPTTSVLARELRRLAVEVKAQRRAMEGQRDALVKLVKLMAAMVDADTLDAPRPPRRRVKR